MPTSTPTITTAQRFVLANLDPVKPRTPAAVRVFLPGRVPATTVRNLCRELEALGLARTEKHPHHPSTTAWVRIQRP